MVKKVVLSSDDSEEEAPQVLQKSEAQKSFQQQKMSIKPHAIKKAPKL